MKELTPDLFKKALLAERGAISDRHRAMLKAHYQADEHTLTATELAAAARYDNYSAANLHYGKLGKLLGAHLPFEPNKKEGGTPIWITILAVGDPETPEGEHYRWIMRPELVQALKELPWGMDK
ncbi:hypothetical protein [Pontiella sulfatireligans]|uniref:Uncharacterized protein n=1 Tax=Pontiella sulfatireligans TaxID=2750658 RepID=A0A6C2UL57_9BACT|nr:hypothetical protein [Pontiella sulfatireligans]VGO20975.1 hypothetical protein SCARR_03043 [Pontiella sulfatireligans]